jgi:hypothetical protein
MKAIQIIAQDLFDKVRSRFSNLEMGDEAGAVTISPADARFFDFDFVSEGNDLGRVSISLNNLGSLKIYYSQGITENQDDPAKKLWYSFLKEMRMFAMRRLLRFDTRDIAKTNLDKHDFQHLAATQGPKEEEPEMNTTMNESRWSEKSSKKTSRAVKGSTEVIVRHANPVDEEYAGSRSQRKNIKAIFIQNKDGERFKYPFIHPAGAFAMAQHVDHGGVPHDPAGKAIITMSEQIAQLQEFQRKIQRTSLHDDAMGITERAVGRLQELKARVEALSKRHHYESWVTEFNGQDPMGNDIMELDAVTMEEYKSKFTEINFKEELSSFFPLLHSIMREANKVDLEDYVEEAAAPWETDDEAEAREKDGKKEPSTFKKPNNPNRTGNDTAKALAQKGIPKKEGFEKFEEWAEATEQGKLTDDQISALKQALTDLPEGQLDLDTAYSFFNEFGLDDDDLAEKFQQAKVLDNTADPIQIFQLWAKESYPELLVALGMSGTEAPAEPAPEEPAPEQPVAENLHPEVVNMVSKLKDLNPVDRYSAYSNIRGYFKGNPELSKLASDLMGGYYEADMLRGKYKTDAAKAKFAELEPMHQEFITQALGQEQGVAEAVEDSTYYQVAKILADKGIKYDSSKEGELINTIGMVLVKELNMSPKQARGLISYDDDFLADTLSALHHMNQDKNTDMVPPPGAMEESEKESKGSMVQEVAKIVKSFYNKDNPTVGPFRGEEGIALDVKKQIEEKFGEEAGEQAHQMAEAFIDKLTKEWQQNHGKVANGHGDDGLARLKELLGNIKTKVEGIGDQGQGGKDFNKNIMPAEDKEADDWHPSKHVTDPQKKKELAPHDKDVKRDSYKDRADYLDKAGVPKSESAEMESILKLAGLAK